MFDVGLSEAPFRKILFLLLETRFVGVGWAESEVYLPIALKGWWEHGEMTWLKFRQLVCSGHNGSHHQGMQGLKTLGLKMAQIVSGSGPLYEDGEHAWECGAGRWMERFGFSISFLFVSHVFCKLLPLWKVLNSVSLRKDCFSLSLFDYWGQMGALVEISIISNRRNRTVISNSFVSSAVKHQAYPLSSLKSSAQTRSCFWSGEETGHDLICPSVRNKRITV